MAESTVDPPVTAAQPGQPLDPVAAIGFIRKLDEDRKQCLESIQRTEDLLRQLLEGQDTTTTKQPQSRPITTERFRRDTGNTFATTLEVESVQKDSAFSLNDESDTDSDESLYVQHTLPPESFNEEGLRKHISDYNWTEAGKKVLGSLLENERPLHERVKFPSAIGDVDDRSHLTHYSIFDVGNDGAPLRLEFADKAPLSRARDIWRRINSINADKNRQKLAVGRITILREPSPLLFAALHYTMKDHFDVDEMFQLLVEPKTKGLAHRPWSENPKHRKTFVFTFEYFTIVGEECQPMSWQRQDKDLGQTATHVPVSRCASVIALSLEGEPVQKIRHRGRRNQVRKEGDIYDPFSPWHVLSMTAYPDWRSSINSHDSTKHYVNGPEAFLMSLRAEFKDAQKRLMDVYNAISDLVTTPADFMFNQELRDKLLFEDDEFTYSRRYFWAYQSLAIMNEDIKEMKQAYTSTFTEAVWSGHSSFIWPGEETSARHMHWRKRMANIRRDIEVELKGLDKIDALNDEKMKEIKALRENLFSGTSVAESRESIQQQATAVVQGNNIKVLTLVTIFFLPLTFVTSVFGMTNMDPKESFIHFGIVTAVICVPTYMLIGSLNTGSGFKFWTRLFTGAFWKHKLAILCQKWGYKAAWAQRYQDQTESTSIFDRHHPHRPRRAISQSTMDAINARKGFAPPGPTGTYAMSPVISQERRTAIRFDAKQSTDFLPSSPVTQVSDPLKARRSVGSVQEVMSDSSQNDANGSWLWRVFSRKAKGEANDDEKKYP